MRILRLMSRLGRDECGSTLAEYGAIGLMVAIGAGLVLSRVLSGTPIH